ncbi:DUF4395 domain-containing protein [Actinoplanes sp. NPDC049265]|uniref:DUF4395 domain-containing protein n=1 Tax=Actinoplanes sp. NPDC049265 TaxID=3363902 RepID=UPI0037200086
MELDPRSVRFGAAMSSIMLVVVLLTGSGWIALAQAAVFALTAVAPSYGPYSVVYRLLVRPRLGPPAEMEPAAPPRFAQTLGLAFTVVAAIGYLTGVPVLGLIFAAFALMATFLNAAFGFCLGCHIYLAVNRIVAARGV